MQIGNLRAWMLEKIEKGWADENLEQYAMGYEQAMKDVAYYYDFPLDEKAWKVWRG